MKNTNPAAESGAFIRRARGYSVVQNEALFNDRLSMSAKGSYALISARIDYTAVPLTKQFLRILKGVCSRISKFFQVFFRICICIGNMLSPDPQANCDFSISQRIFSVFWMARYCITANIFTGAYQSRRPCKLLCSQQSQGVAHNNSCPIRIGKMRKAPVEYSKCGQSEVCLCFSAAGRKPNQIHNISVAGSVICNRLDTH